MHTRLTRPCLYGLMLALFLTLVHSPTVIARTNAITHNPISMSSWIIYLRTANPTTGKSTDTETIVDPKDQTEEGAEIR